MLYECLLLLGILGLGFMVPHLLLGVFFQMALPGPVLLLHVFLLLGIYFIWCWRRAGQTLAMQTWKLKLVSVTGAAPTDQQLLLRYLLSWPSILFFGVGLIWAYLDRDRQFMHDRLAGTRIEFTR